VNESCEVKDYREWLVTGCLWCKQSAGRLCKLIIIYTVMYLKLACEHDIVCGYVNARYTSVLGGQYLAGINSFQPFNSILYLKSVACGICPC
jgi:hypothetical protein